MTRPPSGLPVSSGRRGDLLAVAVGLVVRRVVKDSAIMRPAPKRWLTVR